MSVERPRIRCHSSFKHYQIFHSNHSESSYGNSIYTTTYNFNGGQICGGGFWGGFFGGIGMGIGNFFGNLLGGFTGFGGGFNFGNFGFGNFGFGGGMMSAPFSMFGNSTLFNPTNFWNIGNRNNTAGESVKDKEEKETDQDKVPLKDLVNELKTLIKKANSDSGVTKKEKDDIIKKINDYQLVDDIGTVNNNKTLESLKEKAEKLKVKEGDTNSPAVEQVDQGGNNGAQPVVNPQTPVTQTSPSEQRSVPDFTDKSLSGILDMLGENNVKPDTAEFQSKFNELIISADIETLQAARSHDNYEKLTPAQKNSLIIKLDNLKFGSDDWDNNNNKSLDCNYSLAGYSNGANGQVNTIEGAFDNHSNIAPHPVKNKVAEISESKYKKDDTETKFPMYISINDDSGKLHKYKCIGLTTNGYAVYRTPSSDGNNNQYVLVFNGTNYRLTQEGTPKDWGKSKEDLQ